MRYYPVYLDLRNRHCVVIGGGSVAEGKVKPLLEAGATVTVISARITQGLQSMAVEGQIAHIARNYQHGDLVEMFLAISATDDREVNEQVWQEAVERNIMVNVVDDPPRCAFIVPSVVRQGDLSIAISTGGKAPALSVRLRQKFEREFGAEYGRFLELAGSMREPLARHYPDFEQRRQLWYKLVDSDIFELLAQGDEQKAVRRIVEIMDIAPYVS